MMKIKKIVVFSLAKILGLAYALIGLILGSVLTVLTVTQSIPPDPDPLTDLIFGRIAILAMPILYGIGGFIGGLITSLLYNIVAKWTGGVVIETE